MRYGAEVHSRAMLLYKAERAIIRSSWNVSAERGYVSKYPPGWFDDDLWNRCVKRARAEGRKSPPPSPLSE